MVTINVDRLFALQVNWGGGGQLQPLLHWNFTGTVKVMKGRLINQSEMHTWRTSHNIFDCMSILVI